MRFRGLECEGGIGWTWVGGGGRGFSLFLIR